MIGLSNSNCFDLYLQMLRKIHLSISVWADWGEEIPIMINLTKLFMKRFFTVISLSAALLLVFQFPASGQVRVLKNGHVRIGTCTGADLIGGSRVGAVGGTVTGGAENANTCDTISTLSIQGDGLSGSGGRIGFGHSADVFVSSENASLGKSPKLLLHGEGGFSIGNRESELIGYTGSESGSEGIARTKVKFTPRGVCPGLSYILGPEAKDRY